MDIKDFYFIPHSDTGGDELEIINQHDNLIKDEKYEEATTLLNEEQFEKGVRASLFNSIQNKIRKLQLYLLNKYVASPLEYFSDTEPTDEEMGDKQIWVKPWD